MMQKTMINFRTKSFQLLFIIIGVLFVHTGYGQTVSIKGITAGQVNELVRIIIYDDQFSKLEKTLASTYTDSAGNFEIEFDVAQTLFSYLAVGLKRGEFYLSPNSNYHFNILPDTNSQQGSIFDELPLQFTYKVEDQGLSDAIGAFNFQYNTFLYQYANKIYYGRNKDFILEFENKINEQFSSVNNVYLKNYIRYAFGSLEWTSKMKNNDSIIAEYFVGNPILYKNIQYTDFLADFFKTYFIVDNVFSYHELIDAINNGGLQDVRLLILRNNLFKNDLQLTELTSILLVAWKYYNVDVRKSRVLKILEEIESSSKYQENNKIVGNYTTKLQILESGTPAPGFSLVDARSTKHSLSDYQGNFVLLSFIKPSCRICLEHLRLLDELAKKFPGKVQNVSIVYGDGIREVIKYSGERNYDWPFLDIRNNILLLEAYNIRAYPSYVIINPDGAISMATAPMPDENLDLYLQRQMKRFEKKQRGE